MPEGYLVIGEITKPQGVQGELKARPITCDPERFRGLEAVYLLEKGQYVRRGVRVRSVSDEAVFFRMDGVETREDAEKMRGAALYIDREHAVRLGEDENFLVDLIGCEALDENGTVYGEIKDVLQPGGNDVYVIAGRRGEILVPALKSVVTRVDVENKKMHLDSRRLREVAVFPDSEEVR